MRDVDVGQIVCKGKEKKCVGNLCIFNFAVNLKLLYKSIKILNLQKVPPK
jgi:hypothetical protein